MSTTKTEVLVLGAGAGGLVAANTIAHRGHQVTLIEKSPFHAFQPGNLFIAFQGHRPERYIRPVPSLVDPRVNLVQDMVTKLDLADRRVETKNGKVFEYEIIIAALGTALDMELVPGVAEAHEKFGSFFASPQLAEKLWTHIHRLATNGGKLLVVVADPLYKCPPAPHKAAFLSDDTFKAYGGKASVTLAVPFPHAYASGAISGAFEEEMAARGIEIVTGFTLDEIDVENGVATSLEGESVKFDVAAIVPPHKGPEVEVTPAEAVDGDGYFKVNKYTLQITDYDDAYAIGDCNNAPTSKTGVTAHLAADVVSDRIEGLDAKFTGRTNCPVLLDGKAAFVISDYDHPPVPLRFTVAKRLFEDFFVAAYWAQLRSPWKWRPVFHPYFEATQPARLGPRGW